MITPRIFKINGALLAKINDYAPWINIERRTCVQVPTPVSLLYFQLSSAMSLTIHKIVSKKRCQSYFISQRSPHHGISKDSALWASAHRCPHYAYVRLCFRNSQFSSTWPLAKIPRNNTVRIQDATGMPATVCRSHPRSRKVVCGLSEWQKTPSVFLWSFHRLLR